MQSFLIGHVSFPSHHSHCFPLDCLLLTLLLLKCSVHTGHSFPVEVLPTLRRMEGLLRISYKLYPCLYIPVRCLSRSLNFYQRHLHFLELPETDGHFPGKLMQKFFLAALFTYFPLRTCWFLLKLDRTGNPSSDNFKHCSCVNTLIKIDLV